MSVIRKEGPLMTELRSFINKRSEKKNISFIIGINVLNVLYLIISLGCTFDLRGKTQGSYLKYIFKNMKMLLLFYLMSVFYSFGNFR